MAGPVFKARGGGGEAPFSVDYEAGDRIFAEGELGTEMYVIQAGRVEITQEVEGEPQAPAVLENSEISIRMMRKLSRRVRLADELLSEVGVLSYRGVRALAEPVPEPTPSSQYLLHEEDGEKFYLVTKGATRVGREDPVTGIDPEIDLSAIDEQRSTSRCHATIRVDNGNYFLVEEIGTTNGTCVKEERLKTDVPVQIEDGDPLRFGLVELTFRVSS
jgi:hypothetical protein